MSALFTLLDLLMKVIVLLVLGAGASCLGAMYWSAARAPHHN